MPDRTTPPDPTARLGQIADELAVKRRQIARSPLGRLATATATDPDLDAVRVEAALYARQDRLSTFLTLVTAGREERARELLAELAGRDAEIVDALGVAGETIARLAAEVTAGVR